MLSTLTRAWPERNIDARSWVVLLILRISSINCLRWTAAFGGDGGCLAAYASLAISTLKPNWSGAGDAVHIVARFSVNKMAMTVNTEFKYRRDGFKIVLLFLLRFSMSLLTRSVLLSVPGTAINDYRPIATLTEVHTHFDSGFHFDSIWIDRIMRRGNFNNLFVYYDEKSPDVFLDVGALNFVTHQVCWVA